MKRLVILSKHNHFEMIRRKLTEGNFNKDWKIVHIGSAGEGIRAVNPDLIIAYYPPAWDRQLTELYDNVISKMARCQGKIFRYDDIFEPFDLDALLQKPMTQPPHDDIMKQVVDWLKEEFPDEDIKNVHVSINKKK